MTKPTHPLMIPRYTVTEIPVISVDSPGQWSGFFFVRQLCKVPLNKTGMSPLNVTTGMSSTFLSSKAKNADCLNHSSNSV